MNTTKRNIIAALTVFLLSMVMFYLFHTNIIDNFGLSNWYLDFRFGPFRRATAGELFHLFSNIFSLQSTDIKDTVLFIHDTAIVLIGIGLALIMYIIRSKYKAPVVFTWAVFVTFLSSFFFKNLISLAGYLDVYIVLFTTWSLLFVLLKQNVIALLLITASALIHEETIFFWCSICLMQIAKTKDLKKWMIYAVIPVFATIMLASCPFPNEHFFEFFKNTPPEYQTYVDRFQDFYNSQKSSLISVIQQRIQSITTNLGNEILATILFLIPGFILIGFYIYKIFRSSLNLPIKAKKLRCCIYIAACLPCFIIMFLGIDTWRILNFVMFSIFIVNILILTDKMNCEILTSSFSRAPVFTSTVFIVALCYVPLPYIITGDFKCNLPNENINPVRNYIFANSPWDTFTLAYSNYYNFRNDKNNAYIWPNGGLAEYGKSSTIQARRCLPSGNMLINALLSPGKKEVSIIMIIPNGGEGIGRHALSLGGTEVDLQPNNVNKFILNNTTEGTTFDIKCLPAEEMWGITLIQIEPAK